MHSYNMQLITPARIVVPDSSIELFHSRLIIFTFISNFRARLYINPSFREYLFRLLLIDYMDIQGGTTILKEKEIKRDFFL